MKALRSLSTDQQVGLLFVILFGLLLAVTLAAFFRSLREDRNEPAQWRHEMLKRELLAVWVAAVLFWIIRSTDLGRAIRAVAKEKQGAKLMGIDVEKVYALSLGIGMACLGAAACFLLPAYYVNPQVGGGFVLVAFTIVVLGGMGSFVGALVGGLLETLGITKQALHRPMKYLQESGYVVSERDAVEHRVKLLRLTPKGSRMERTASDYERAAMQAALGTMSPSDQKAWREVMIALARQA